MYIFRLGAISTLLSETFVNGFTTGAAIQVLLSQVFDLIGLNSAKPKGHFKFMKVGTALELERKKNSTPKLIRLCLYRSFLFFFPSFQTIVVIFNDIPSANTAAVIISLIASCLMILSNELVKVRRRNNVNTHALYCRK